MRPLTPGPTDGDTTAGDTTGDVDLSGAAVDVQAAAMAATATEMRSFFVTAPPGPLFLGWLTWLRKLWFA